MSHTPPLLYALYVHRSCVKLVYPVSLKLHVQCVCKSTGDDDVLDWQGGIQLLGKLGLNGISVEPMTPVKASLLAKEGQHLTSGRFTCIIATTDRFIWQI